MEAQARKNSPATLRSFGWLLDIVRIAEREWPRAVRAPATTMARATSSIVARFQREIDRHGPDQFLHQMLVALATIPDDDWSIARLRADLSRERTAIARFPRGSEL